MEPQRSDERSADYLKRCIVDFDYLPVKSSACYREYGFANCASDSDAGKLFGLYTGLIKILGCDLDKLHDACREGKLKEFIKDGFETGCARQGLGKGAYYPWFLQNQDLVRNENTPAAPKGDPVPCNVCQAPCTTKCANCKQVGYCSRAHQTKDWQEHKKNCFPVKIVADAPNKIKGGAVLVATRPIKQGEIFIKERPLLSAPFLPNKAKADAFPLCLGCHKIMGSNAYVCSSCEWPVCDKECELAPQHANYECHVFQDHHVPPLDFQRRNHYLTIMAIRLLCTRNSDPETWAKMERMCADPLQQFRSSFAMDFVTHCIDGPTAEDFKEHMDEVINIMDANRKVSETFIGNPRRDTHIYNLSSFTDHNCIPNSMWVIQRDGKCFIRASTAIEAGEIISTSDTEVATGTKERQKILSYYQVHCTCKRCKDPTECGTYLSAIRCKKCADKEGEGYLLPVDPLDPESQWSCTNKKCKNIESSDHVAGRVAELKEKVDRILAVEPITADTIKAMEDIIINATNNEVHANHHQLGLLKRRYAYIAAEIIPHMQVGEAFEMADTMASGIKEYLAMMKIIWPGYTRHRGQILYGQQIVLFWLICAELERMSLAKPNMKELEVKVPVLVDAFKEVLATRKEAHEILSIEPNGGIEHSLSEQLLEEDENFIAVRRTLGYYDPL